MIEKNMNFFNKINDNHKQIDEISVKITKNENETETELEEGNKN